MDLRFKEAAVTKRFYISLLATTLVICALLTINQYLMVSTNTGSPVTNKGDISLSNYSPVVVKAEHISYLAENSSINKNDLLNSTLGQWKTIESKHLSLGRRDMAIWYRIPIKNTNATTINQVLEIQWPNLYSAELYRYNTNLLSYAVQHRGLSTQPIPNRTSSPTPAFYFTLAPHESTVLYLRVKTSYFQYVPMTFWAETLFQQQLQSKIIIYSLCFGALSAMLIFNLFLFLKLRSKTYIFYSMYILSINFYQLCVTGYGQNLLWFNNIPLKLISYELSVYLGFLFCNVFIRYFLHLKRNLKRVNSILIIYWSMATLSLLMGYSIPQQVSEIVAALSCLIALFTGYYLFIRGYRNALYFCIAWVFLTLSAIALLLMVIGFLPYSPIIEYGQMMGFVTAVLTISLALAGNLHVERLHRIVAQEKALQLEKQVSNERAAKLAAHKALLKAQDEQNALLEQKVIHRTHELEFLAHQLETANQQLSEISLTDPLTNLNNRRFLDQNLEMVSKSATRANSTLSMLLIDIDHFKNINDTYGHLAGDTCLVKIAGILKKHINRATDSIARYGGEEFAIVLPGTHEKDLVIIAEALRKDVADSHVSFNGHKIKLTVSIGCATVRPSEFIPPDCLIALTDKALYRAKNNGRNRCECSFTL
ncbi:sensor domain-containing diguanylate cyclase [Neptunomonas phycophila]|uniref:sensor domain-containing diguanylate cyclase n=1 Tax=Neptunomonas phycophila TaxID=1572645 RepID=UPI0023F94842|nr:diguanylate cyclase [Neptunomonas phycophila]